MFVAETIGNTDTAADFVIVDMKQGRSHFQRHDLHESRLDAVSRPESERCADPHDPAGKDGHEEWKDCRQAGGRAARQALTMSR